MFEPMSPVRLPQSAFERSLDAIDDDGKDSTRKPGEGWEAWDDVKNRPLDPGKVQKARCTEMEYVKAHKVYGYAPIEECRKNTGREPIETS